MTNQSLFTAPNLVPASPMALLDLVEPDDDDNAQAAAQAAPAVSCVNMVEPCVTQRFGALSQRA